MEKTKPFDRLINLLLLERKEIISIYFYAIISGLLQLTLPLGVQAIIGFALGTTMVTSIYVLIVVIVIGVAIVGIMQINQMKIIEKIQQKIFTRYAFLFAETIPKLDLVKNEHSYLPEKVNRFFETLNLQKGLSKLLLDIPLASIQICLGLVLLAIYHPAFIIFDSILLFILLVILRFTGKNGLKTSLEESAYKYKTVAWLEEMARVIKTFKLTQGTHINLKKTDGFVFNYLSSRTAHFSVLIFQYRILVIFKVIITASMLIVGSYLLINQKINIGEFIAAEIVILIVIGAVEKLISNLDSVYDIITGLEKIALFLESPMEQNGSLNPGLTQKGVTIKLNDFNFGFSANNPILKNINLEIPAGSTVCIMGSEGSGKSVFLNVLATNYKQFTGSFQLNSLPINSYNFESLRNKIGIYANESALFQGTLWDNISLGKTAITTKKVMEIAELLGIDSFLNKFENGFETNLAPNTNNLSNTLIKKILLLRTFANEPALLLLDEPLASLNADISNKITEFILSNPNKATIIVANNNKEFANKCDYQIHLMDGSLNVYKN